MAMVNYLYTYIVFNLFLSGDFSITTTYYELEIKWFWNILNFIVVGSLSMVVINLWICEVRFNEYQWYGTNILYLITVHIIHSTKSFKLKIIINFLYVKPKKYSINISYTTDIILIFTSSITIWNSYVQYETLYISVASLSSNVSRLL